MATPMHERNVIVEFYMDSVEFKHESEKQGRPVFREIPHIRVQVPGDRNNIPVSKVMEYHKQRYPMAWAAFERGLQEPTVSGTKLTEWPQITRSQCKEAEYFGVYTVEQLASVSDGNLQRMGMGWLELRRKAQAFLDIAASTAAQTAQAEENQRLKDQLASMQQQIQALSDRAEEEKRKPGRPKKEAVEA